MKYYSYRHCSGTLQISPEIARNVLKIKLEKQGAEEVPKQKRKTCEFSEMFNDLCYILFYCLKLSIIVVCKAPQRRDSVFSERSDLVFPTARSFRCQSVMIQGKDINHGRRRLIEEGNPKMVEA